MSREEVEAIATFYELIFRKPVGKHVILVCDSVSCWITGEEKITAHLQQTAGRRRSGGTTADGAVHAPARRLPRRLRRGTCHDDRRKAVRHPHARTGGRDTRGIRADAEGDGSRCSNLSRLTSGRDRAALAARRLRGGRRLPGPAQGGGTDTHPGAAGGHRLRAARDGAARGSPPG